MKEISAKNRKNERGVDDRAAAAQHVAEAAVAGDLEAERDPPVDAVELRPQRDRPPAGLPAGDALRELALAGEPRRPRHTGCRRGAGVEDGERAGTRDGGGAQEAAAIVAVGHTPDRFPVRRGPEPAVHRIATRTRVPRV